MFELSLPHILLLLVIALFVIGPKNLPDIAKTLGKIFGEFQRAADDLKHEIQTSSQPHPTDNPEQKPPDMKPGEPSESKGTEPASADSATHTDKNIDAASPTAPPEKPS